MLTNPTSCGRAQKQRQAVDRLLAERCPRLSYVTLAERPLEHTRATPTPTRDMATVLSRPAAALPGLRPGPGATPQQIADFHYRQLVADGAIPAGSPFESRGAGTADRAGFDYFYGRATRAPSASVSPFPEEALAQLSAAGLGDPLSFGLWATPDDEDALIARQLSEAHEAEKQLLDSLNVPEDDGEEFIREQAGLMREAQRLRGLPPASPPLRAVSATPAPHGTPTPCDAPDAASSAAASSAAAPTATEPDSELEAALALSAQLIAEADSAALEHGLALSASETVADTAVTPADSDECATEAGVDIPFTTPSALAGADECAEAGVDIPFTTPSTLLDESSSFRPSPTAAGASAKGEASQSSAAAASKGARGKGKRSKGKGSQV